MATWPLARTRRRNVLFGVLAGVAAWLHATTFAIRALFLLILLLGPGDIAFGLYIALAIALPVAVEPEDETPQPKWGASTLIVLYLVCFILIPLGWVLLADVNTPIRVAIEVAIVVFVFYLVWKSWKNSKSEAKPERIGLEPRTPLNYVMRAALAVTVFTFIVSATTSYSFYFLTAGLLAATVTALFTHKSRAILLSVTSIAVIVSLLLASVGMPLNRAILEYYDGDKASPLWAEHTVIYQDIDMDHGIARGFGAGETTVHVHAPDDARIVFEGRVTVGTVVVRNVDENDNVINTVSSESGFWADTRHTYGNGAKTIRVKVHGGAGRLMLNIDRS